MYIIKIITINHSERLFDTELWFLVYYSTYTGLQWPTLVQIEFNYHSFVWSCSMTSAYKQCVEKQSYPYFQNHHQFPQVMSSDLKLLHSQVSAKWCDYCCDLCISLFLIHVQVCMIFSLQALWAFLCVWKWLKSLNEHFCLFQDSADTWTLKEIILYLFQPPPFSKNMLKEFFFWSAPEDFTKTFNNRNAL